MRRQKETGSLTIMNCHTSPGLLTSGLLSCLNHSDLGVFGSSVLASKTLHYPGYLPMFFLYFPLKVSSILDLFNLSSLSLSNWFSLTLSITSMWMIHESVFLIITSLLNIRPTFPSAYGVFLAGYSGTWNISNLTYPKLNLTYFLKCAPPSIPYFC